MKKYVVIGILLVCCIISLSLHLYESGKPCLNEDEASHGYNAYSVLQTGRDEYGDLPIRFLAFGEHKLPFAGMLSSPFIALFGLSVWTVRMPTLIVGTLFPLLLFAALYSISRNQLLSIIAAIFGTPNIWIQVWSRHLHEGVVFVGIMLMYIAVLFWKRELPKKHMILLAIFTLCSLFSYHSAKVVMPVIALYSVVLVFVRTSGGTKKKALSGLTLCALLSVAFAVFVTSEYLAPNNRVSNLSYFTNPVFVYEIEAGRERGGSTLFYNRPVYGAYQLFMRTAKYLSPDFLLFESDKNPRFGASYLPLLTWLEYALFSIGVLNILLKLATKGNRANNVFLLTLLVVSILPASLALQEGSSTRSGLLIVPLIMLIARGTLTISEMITRFFHSPSAGRLMIVGIVLVQLVLISGHWSTYFHRYLGDSKTRGAWQCGMEDVAVFAWKNYQSYDRIAISSPMGQPYIYMLFYGGPYPPASYQKIAKKMPYNEYGFWEQDSFDKFLFEQKPRCERGVKSLNIVFRKEDADPALIEDRLQVHSDGTQTFYSFTCQK